MTTKELRPESFATGTKKLTVELVQDSSGEWRTRIADDLGNFTTFPGDDDQNCARMSAQFLADKIAALARRK